MLYSNILRISKGVIPSSIKVTETPGVSLVDMQYTQDILPFITSVISITFSRQLPYKDIQTVVGSKRLLNNANWARYNLAVSHRKETEPSSSAIWNMNLPGKPAVDFHNFFDGENITQTDLVAWVNVGMHHLPVSEDSPNTKTNLAASRYVIHLYLTSPTSNCA